MSSTLRPIRILSFSLSLFWLAGAAMAQQYTVMSLTGLNAQALNNSGQLAGTLASNGHVFLTGPDGIGPADLGNFGEDLFVSAVNSSGQVAGGRIAIDPITQAVSSTGGFVTGPNGQGLTGASVLGSMGAFVSGINDAGQAIGTAYPTSSIADRYPFLLNPGASSWTALSIPGAARASVSDINASGQISGSLLPAGTTQRHAFLMSAAGGAVLDLGTFGGVASTGSALNASGQVAGTVTFANGSLQGFVTGPQGQGVTMIVPPGSSVSPFMVNAQGVVVGDMDSDDGSELRAFIFRPGDTGAVDLNTLATAPGGHYFSDFWSINDSGQLLVSDETGFTYLLTPVPEPASWALMVAGIAMLCRRRRSARD